MGDTLYASTAVVDELRRLNRLLDVACEQISLLNQELRGLDARYIRAQRDNKKAFLITIGLRRTSLEDILILFLGSAQRKADSIEKIKEKLREENRRVPSRN